MFVLLEMATVYITISCILQVLEDNEVVADEKSRALEEETKDIKLTLTNNEERLTELERRKDVGTRDLQATKEKADMLEKRGNDLSDTIEKVGGVLWIWKLYDSFYKSLIYKIYEN